MRLLRNLPNLALFALFYVAAGKLGLQLAFVHANASAVWPPTGIAIAGALVLGYRVWPAIFIGAFVVNITTAGNVATSLGIAMGNTLEALVAAWLVNRFAGGRHAFDRAQGVFKFAGLAAVAATMVSATIGAGTLALAGFAPWSDFGLIWRTWWLGDAGGALVVAPLLLSWAANPRMNLDGRRTLEFVGVLFFFVLAAVIVFDEWFVVIGKGYPLLFPLLPFLLWIGFRFGQRETATAVFALAIVAVTSTVRGFGPFSVGTQNESLLALQAFLGTMTIMSMTLTAAVSERRRSEQRLEAQQATTRILAESQSLSEAMPKILEAICKTLHWEVGNYWTVNSINDHLECAATWPEQSEALARFVAVSKESKFRRGIGMPGRVWESGRVAWIEDVVHDPNFPRAPVADSTGLHSAFGFPLSSRGRVFGVVEFFTREFRASKQKLLAMAAAVGGQIAQFVERKEAERAMIENEALYRTMAETASDAFLTVDESGTILFANRAAEQTFGFEVAEMIGRELTMLMPGGITGVSNVRPSTGDLAARAAGGRSLRSAEVFGREKGGHIFPLEISIGGFEENGRRIWTVIARDISERKETEKMLAQHACIVELSNDAIYSKSIEGIITSWNKAAERLFGYTAEEILGRDVLILVPPEYVEEERQILARVGRGERIASYETVRRHKEQRLLDISLTVSPIRTDGEISGLSAIARDVTEQKRAAEELARQKVAAEAANQAKDNFLAMLSHELRTPLSPVVSAIDHLEPKVAEMPELQEAIAVIRRNVEHQARLIDDLLDLTRVVKGKLELRREVLDAHRCILDALEPCRAEIDAKKIVVRTEFRAREHLVNADRTKLQQIIWNLVKNAVKFSREGGAVSIVTENKPAELLVVHVRDNGIGIEPEMLRRIFNPFEQGERSIQRRYGGLGLGLAVSKALAEAHGGTVSVASEGRDTGAAFTLRLGLAPALAAPTRSGKTEPSAQRPGRELRILLVEDHEDTRHSMERLLRRRGYHVESANSVGAAIELAAERSFDLVISDIGLPDNSGLELMRRLQQARPIKGIAVSGFGMEGDLERSKAAGFSDHLLKPVNFNDLEAAIWNVTSSLH